MKISERKEGEQGLTITKDGVEYKLPVHWSLTDSGSYTFRSKLQSRAFAHGSDAVGMGKLTAGPSGGVFHGRATEEEHDEVLNEAYTFFGQMDYSLMAGRPDRVYHVACLSKIKHKFENGFKQRRSNITVSLLLADPFRYEAQESKVVFLFPQATVQAEMVPQPGGSGYPLTFRFIPKDRMTNLTVWHQEAKEKFTLTDALLVAPKTSIVNGREGTVWRDKDNNSINAFTEPFSMPNREPQPVSLYGQGRDGGNYLYQQVVCMTNFIFGRGIFGWWIFAGPTGEGAVNSDRGKVHEYYPGQFVVYAYKKDGTRTAIFGGESEANALNEVTFEITSTGCGQCQLTFYRQPSNTQLDYMQRIDIHLYGDQNPYKAGTSSAGPLKDNGDQVRVQKGYGFYNRLENVMLWKTYENMDVGDIVRDIARQVEQQTLQVVYNDSKIQRVGYSPTKLVFDGVTVKEALSTLADFAVDYVYGVDEYRCLYFRRRETSVNEQARLTVGNT